VQVGLGFLVVVEGHSSRRSCGRCGGCCAYRQALGYYHSCRVWVIEGCCNRHCVWVLPHDTGCSGHLGCGNSERVRGLGDSDGLVYLGCLSDSGWSGSLHGSNRIIYLSSVCVTVESARVSMTVVGISLVRVMVL